MSVADCEAIIERLDRLEPAQVETLMDELQVRMAQPPKKRRLEDCLVVPDEARGTGEDWVGGCGRSGTIKAEQA